MALEKSIRLLINKPIKEIYLCDPSRNTECRRSVGGECSNEYCAATAHPEYAQLDEYGKPIKLSDIRSV